MNAALHRYHSMRAWEARRMVLTMPLEGSAAIFLLVAVQYFEASPVAKSIIAASPFMGLILAPVMLQLVSKLQLAVSKAMAGLYCLSAICCLAAAFAGEIAGFLLGVTGFSIFACVTPPLTVAMWRQNSPDQSRGGLFSRLLIWGLGSKILLSLALSFFLGDNIERYWLVPVLFGVLLLLAAYCVYQIPTDPPERQGHLSLPKQFGLIWHNRTFGLILAIWMLFAFANLATLPLRTEYVASGTDFAAYTPMMVVILLDVIPTSMRLLSLPLWGKYFDRMNFLIVRMLINLLFGVSIMLFFLPYFFSQVIASVLHGLAHGGGSLVWNLWVTKYAPPERTADYMAVHTSLTGMRGIIAPGVAYLLIGSHSFQEVAYLACGLVALSILLLALMLALELRPQNLGATKPSI